MADSPTDADWIDRAERDAEFARSVAPEKRSRFAPMICFLCQQAAEKYVKACLIRARKKFPRTHDFAVLLALCRETYALPGTVDSAAGRLQTYVIEGRYPTAVPTVESVDQALRDMETVRAACRRALGL